MRDDVGELAGERFRIAGACRLGAAADEARGEAGSRAAGARVAAQQHMALEDVACENGVEIVHRRHRIEIGELDGGQDFLHRRQRRFGRRTAWQIARHAHADFRLGHRSEPALERRRAAGQQQRALHQVADQRACEAELLHGGGRAETHFPAERFLAGGDARAPRGELRSHAFLMSG